MSTLYNVKDAARRANLSASFFNKLRVFGGGPRFVKIGRRVLYDQGDLDAWLTAHKRASTSDTVKTPNRAGAEVLATRARNYLQTNNINKNR